MTVIPYGRHSIDRADIRAVARVLASDRLTQGPMIAAFEHALCTCTGAKYCVAVSNGTAALHLAVMALGLKPGCSGVTTPVTFVASANALVYSGIKPIFADIDPATVNISVDALARKVRKAVKVVIPVHFAGRAASMREIHAIARKNGSFVIEDAAHAIGASYPDGGRVGNCRYADMTVFSFHPVKTITTGEGGAIMTNNKALYEKLCRLRSHGITRDPQAMRHVPGPWYYEMQELGFNYRMTDMQAALGVSQLKKLDRFIARRRNIARRYDQALQDHPYFRSIAPQDKMCAYHLYVIRADLKALGMSRSDLMEKFASDGVGTQVHYIPVYRHPFYRRYVKHVDRDFPAAEKYYRECLSLPIFPAMTDRDVEHVIRVLLGYASLSKIRGKKGGK